jgi:hypothetical protein
MAFLNDPASSLEAVGWGERSAPHQKQAELPSVGLAALDPPLPFLSHPAGKPAR